MQIILALLLLAYPVAAQRYTFRKVAENGPGTPFGYGSPGGMAAINNSGQVVFGSYPMGSGITVFSSSPGGPLRKVIAQDERPMVLPSGVSINDAGTVLVASPTNLYTWSDGQLTLAYQSRPGELVAMPSAFPTLRNDGAIAFSNGLRILLRKPSGEIEVLVNENEIPRPATSFFNAEVYGAALNANGEVAFTIDNPGSSECRGCVLKKTGGRLLRLGQTTETTRAPVINDSGDVAFYSTTPSPGIYIGRTEGTPRLAVDLSNRLITAERTIVNLNNSGTVAFFGRIGSGPFRGIFTGPDPVRDRVIAESDRLFGDVVAGIDSPTVGGLNDKGEIVFFYRLVSENTIGVAVATPTGQPVTPAPAIANGGIVNSASYAAGPVAPGQIVTLFGTNLAPGTAGARLDQGRIATENSGVRVLFDGVPAPILSLTAGQVSVIVPYAAAGRTTSSVVVEVAGRASPAVAVAVTSAAPALFTANATGRGPGAILNQDNTLNTATNPAARGGVVVLYGTGEGQTSPAGIDGKLTVAPLPRPVLPVTATIGGVPADVLYAGGAPGQVAGLWQVNVQVPAALAPGPHPVVVRVGGVASQDGVTVAVR